NNYNIHELDYNDYLEKIAIVQQDVYLFEGSLEDNLMCEDIALIKNFFEKAGLSDWYIDLSSKIISERGSNLSQGEKQIIAIARAYFKNPDVIILDESTSNIDSILEKDLNSIIYKFFEDKIIIVVAHRLSTI